MIPNSEMDMENGAFETTNQLGFVLAPGCGKNVMQWLHHLSGTGVR